MQTVVVQVRGGVAEITHRPPGVETLLFDWDNLRGSTSDEEKLEALEVALGENQLQEACRIANEIEHG